MNFWVFGITEFDQAIESALYYRLTPKFFLSCESLNLENVYATSDEAAALKNLVPFEYALYGNAALFVTVILRNVLRKTAMVPIEFSLSIARTRRKTLHVSVCFCML